MEDQHLLGEHKMSRHAEKTRMSAYTVPPEQHSIMTTSELRGIRYLLTPVDNLLIWIPRTDNL